VLFPTNSALCYGSMYNYADLLMLHFNEATRLKNAVKFKANSVHNHCLHESV
jgi:hypothetical protein